MDEHFSSLPFVKCQSAFREGQKECNRSPELSKSFHFESSEMRADTGNAFGKRREDVRSRCPTLLVNEDVFESAPQLRHEEELMIYHCIDCDSPQNFTIKALNVQVPRDSPPAEYAFAACEVCRATAVFLREDYGTGFDNDSFLRVFPPNSRYLGFTLPSLVQESYDAAVRCEIARIPLPAVVMVGRALEAVCRDHDSKTKTLAQGLQSMLDAGLISKELMDWSSELRVLRNVGAHATREKVELQDAKESLNFLQAILEILYDLRPKFVEMKNRRAKASLK